MASSFSVPALYSEENAENPSAKLEIRGDKVAEVKQSRELPLDTVRTLVIKSVRNRGWSLIEEEEGILQVNLVHRRHDATLTLVYTNNTVLIYSDSWRIGRDGARTRRDHPDGWIANIKKDIERNWEAEVFGL